MLVFLRSLVAAGAKTWLKWAINDELDQFQMIASRHVPNYISPTHDALMANEHKRPTNQPTDRLSHNNNKIISNSSRQLSRSIAKWFVHSSMFIFVPFAFSFFSSSFSAWIFLCPLETWRLHIVQCCVMCFQLAKTEKKAEEVYFIDNQNKYLSFIAYNCMTVVLRHHTVGTREYVCCVVITQWKMVNDAKNKTENELKLLSN